MCAYLYRWTTNHTHTTTWNSKDGIDYVSRVLSMYGKNISLRERTLLTRCKMLAVDRKHSFEVFYEFTLDELLMKNSFRLKNNLKHIKCLIKRKLRGQSLMIFLSRQHGTVLNAVRREENVSSVREFTSWSR